MRQTKIIVVGAGIGGLSAALDLCSRGASVTIVEKNDYAGGKVHQTSVAGKSIDSGPTVFTLRPVFDRLFQRAGFQLEDLVELAQLDVLARHFWRGSDTLDLFSDPAQSAEAIHRFSSAKDADHYRRFAQKSAALFNALDLSFMRAQRPGPVAMAWQAGLRDLLTIIRSKPYQSLWQSVCATFDDPRLRQLFARYSTYCGSSPYLAPATLTLIAHAERAGVWTLRGGISSLARALQTAIEARGGEIRLQTAAAEVVCDGSAVTGVVLRNGEHLAADAVVFNGDLSALREGLLGDAAGAAVPRAPDKTLSAITVSTAARPTGQDLSFHNVFFGDDYAKEFEAIFQHASVCADPTIYVCASDRATGMPTSTGGNTERFFCLMNAPAVPLSPETVRLETEKLMRTLKTHGLHIDGSEAARVIAHPGDFNDRFPGSAGALYGQPTHGPFGSFTRAGARTRIRGLYLAGGGVHPGAGVPMVSISGQLAASCIIDDMGR